MRNLSYGRVGFHVYCSGELHHILLVPAPLTFTANLLLVMVGISGHRSPHRNPISVSEMIRGTKDAGEETMKPKREHTMYGGIYKRIRHPQAVGEFPLWWMIAFLVHSPFLVIFSFVYVPVWYYLCVAEERDLLIRYGEAYEEYRAKTGFWFPKKRKL